MNIEHDSYLKGAFKGWTGRGVYRLDDGSVWVQVNYAYQYQYMYRPEARVHYEGSATTSRSRAWSKKSGVSLRAN
jgi:hypothetical protein